MGWLPGRCKPVPRSKGTHALRRIHEEPRGRKTTQSHWAPLMDILGGETDLNGEAKFFRNAAAIVLGVCGTPCLSSMLLLRKDKCGLIKCTINSLGENSKHQLDTGTI